MSGVNYDLSNPQGFFLPQDTVDLGITHIRFPMRSDTDPTLLAEYKSKDIFLLGVLDRTAHDQGVWIPGLDAYQIGNEPDNISPSSWTMLPGDYGTLVAKYRAAHPDAVLIGAGLASGNVAWWRVVSLSTIAQLNGFAVHPYAKTYNQARNLLRAYKTQTPNLPLWISEWNRPAGEIPAFLAMLRQEVSGLCFWFCALDGMVPGMGLVDNAGAHKPEYTALRAAHGN